MTPNDKPEAARLGWKTNSREAMHRGKTFTLRRDRVEIGGEQMDYEYDERAEAVIIVPVTAAGEIVLIEQYRYPVDAWCLEIPAGGCHDAGDLSLEEVVRKELREEIGAAAGAVEQVGWFFTSPSFTDEKAGIYIAWDVVLDQAPDTEASEAIRRRVVPFAKAIALAQRGDVATAPCALALLRCAGALQNRFGEAAPVK